MPGVHREVALVKSVTSGDTCGHWGLWGAWDKGNAQRSGTGMEHGLGIS